MFNCPKCCCHYLRHISGNRLECEGCGHIITEDSVDYPNPPKCSHG